MLHITSTQMEIQNSALICLVRITNTIEDSDERVIVRQKHFQKKQRNDIEITSLCIFLT